MAKVSVLIPSRNEQFLPKTVNDILTKARGDIEVIAVLDGYWPNPPLPNDPRLHLIHRGKAQGMRPAITSAAALAKGEYLLKTDAHCMFDEGFDVKLVEDYHEDNWVVVPRRYSLDAENWCFKQTGKSPVDAHYLSYPFEPNRAGAGLHGTVWNARARARLHIEIDEEMSSQGSCWFMSRKHWDTLINPMEVERYGNFIQEFQEVGLKTWLSGGKVMINKKTWYAHLHKGSEYGRGYWISKKEMNEGSLAAIDYWMNNRWDKRVHDLEWFIDRFWPVPSWPEDWTSKPRTIPGYVFKPFTG